MAERDQDSESSQPRKRIAVACNRCRKRKIRCSGDPGNGGPCSNCKNAGHDPCLFLRVSSTETPLKDQDFGYNLDASRAYQARATVSPLSSVSQYPADIPAGDVMTYRQGSYGYGGNKGYYSGVSGWAGTYPDDSVDQYVNYQPQYQMMSQDPVHMMQQGYSRYGSNKSVYVDPEASTYNYGNLVHRPHVNSDSPNFSLSGMADSLPNTASARVVPSGRLLPQVTRSMTNPSYRTDGHSEQQYPTKGSASHPSSSSSNVTDAYGALNSSFESPVSYTATGTVPSTISHRSASQSDTSSYQPSSTSSATDTIYNTNDQSLRPADDSSTSLSYVYSDRDSIKREPQPSGGASTLSNGHVYIPGSHHHPHVHAPPPSQGYVVSGPSVSQGSVVEGATTAATRSGHSGSSHLHAESHRRSAGSLRGGG